VIAARLAPAKVNLFLHVGPLQADGYHPIATWMVFADIGDRLTLEPAPAWSFAVTGPYADEIGPGENLVEAAAARLFRRAGGALPAARLSLDKQLPVAAGLGGGSSDAGAALRLLNATLETPLREPELLQVAGELGADGPACLVARPLLAGGRGERLTPAPETPALPAVLVNPGRPSSTAAVYRAYDEAPRAAVEQPALPGRFADPRRVAAALGPLRNDLEAPAERLEPVIGSVLAALRLQPETLLARMSGSGATCFALCARNEEAEALARRLAHAQPGWWIKPCRLSAPITNS
jgi:4-diphosphocytidyl-2-C-methyl-D-erythritol kinase